jgi:hypothetical protein
LFFHNSRARRCFGFYSQSSFYMKNKHKNAKITKRASWNSKCGQGKKNCFQPPTFSAKNRRLQAKKIAQNHAQISMHKVEQFLLCLTSYFWHWN